MNTNDIKINMKVKINFNMSLDDNILYDILKERNQPYAYVHRKLSDDESLYILSEYPDKTTYIHLFYSEEFEPFLKEERKLKLQQICSIQEIE